MLKVRCTNCGKVMEGYTKEHIAHMLRQHLESKKCRKQKEVSK